MPLGSGAFAGVSIPIDREFLAKELGFKSLTKNSIDAVSSRDHILDLLFSCTSLMINVSRICEELIIWNSNEFGYINLSDEFTTGSSIMPQKRNPDYLELIRGKTGGVVGELMSLITTLKGLTFTYNRDLQEDRQGAMSSVITVIKTLEVLSTLLSKTTFNKDKMIDNAKNSNILATDFADYLAFKKIPFREAYEIIKKISDTLSKNNKYIHELSLIELQKISPLFEKDVLDINLKSSIEKRNSLGGTSTKSVKNQILEGKKFLITQENGK
jgi:argininosuccinate lyase